MGSACCTKPWRLADLPAAEIESHGPTAATGGVPGNAWPSSPGSGEREGESGGEGEKDQQRLA